MCRLTVLISNTPVALGDIVTRPKKSIIYQSFDASERRLIQNPQWSYEKHSLNGDGFGVGWYVSRECAGGVDNPDIPCVFTGITPAWNNVNLRRLAEKTLSPLIFAHVRAAGPGCGPPTETHCHPFTCGRFMFMHNGAVGGWTQMRHLFVRLLPTWAFDYCVTQGPIDSIVVFSFFLALLKRGPDAQYDTDELLEAFSMTLGIIESVMLDAGVVDECMLNCVVSDGTRVLTSRFGLMPSKGTFSRDTPSCSLYFATGAKWDRIRPPNRPPSRVSSVPQLPPDEGLSRYIMHHVDKQTNVCIITSEPLTDVDHEWVPCLHNHITVATNDVNVQFCRIPSVDELPELVEAKAAPEGYLEAIAALLARRVGPQPTGLFDITLDPPSAGIPPRGLDVTQRQELQKLKTELLAAQQAVSSAPVLSCTDFLSTEANSPILCVASMTVTLTRRSGQQNGMVPADREDSWLSLSLFCSGDAQGRVSIWSLQTRRKLATLTGHQGSIMNIIPFVSDCGDQSPPAPGELPLALLFTGSADTTLAVWDVRAVVQQALRDEYWMDGVNNFGLPTNPIVEAPTRRRGSFNEELYDRPAFRFEFTPKQGDVLATEIEGGDATIDHGFVQLTAKSKGKMNTWLTAQGHRSSIMSPRNSPCDYLASPALTSEASVYDGQKAAKPLLYVGFQNATVVSIDFTEIIEALTGPSQEPAEVTTRILWNASTNTTVVADGMQGYPWISPKIRRLPAAHSGFVECMLYAAPYVISGGGSGSVIVWRDQQVHARLQGHQGGVLCLASDPTDKMLFSGSRDCTIRQWCLQSLSCVQTIVGHTEPVMALEVTQQYLLSATVEGVILVWFRATSEVLCRLESSTPTPLPRNDMGGCKMYPQHSNQSRAVSSLSVETSADAAGASMIVTAAVCDGFLRIWNMKCSPETREDNRSRRQKGEPWRPSCFCDFVSDNDPLITNNRSCCCIQADEELPDGAARKIKVKAELRVFNFESFLRELVAIQSISGSRRHLHHCFSAALRVHQELDRMGAETRLLETGVDSGPVVIGRMGSDEDKPTLLFYSHYDVTPPLGDGDSEGGSSYHPQSWATPPWELCATNGYYYGRGVSDNKGPLAAQLAAVYEAARDSRRSGHSLPVNVMWLVEGDEENGSRGLTKILEENDDILHDISYIIINNSTWLTSNRPCISYGTRGVIDLTLRVTAAKDEQDECNTYGFTSGTHGGSLMEPAVDMVRLLNSFIDQQGKILIPGFSERVAPPPSGVHNRKRCSFCRDDNVVSVASAPLEGDDAAEALLPTGDASTETTLTSPDLQPPRQLSLDVRSSTLPDTRAAYSPVICYDLIYKEAALEIKSAHPELPDPMQHLKSIWYQPSLSVTNVTTSTPPSAVRVIPAAVCADVSIRTVPNQTSSEITDRFTSHLHYEFAKFDTKNRLEIEVHHQHEWWLGDLELPIVRVTSDILQKVWKTDALLIKDGGTMPAASLLQEKLKSPVLMLPLAGPDDNAHLPNESVKIKEMTNGIRILKEIIMSFQTRDVTTLSESFDISQDSQSGL